MFDEVDSAAFFDADMPGYALAVLGAAQVPCLFRGPYQEAFNDVSGSKPSILCQRSDAAAVTEGTAVTVNGISYTVAWKESDLTTGTTRLMLQEA